MEGKFKNRLFVTDLDFTLLDSVKKISSENKKAIDYFKNKGGIFTVATGRSLQAADRYLDELDIKVPVATHNGAVVYDTLNNEIIDCKYLDDDIYSITGEIIKQFPKAGVEIFRLKDTYLCRESEYAYRHLKITKLPFVKADLDDVPKGWIRILLTQENDYLKEIYEYINKKYKGKYFTVFSEHCYLEIINPNANKGLAVLKIADILKVKQQNLYTIGDNYNDIAMLKCAFYSFAPENSNDDIKKQASFVVSSCDDNAVAEAIWYLDSVI